MRILIKKAHTIVVRDGKVVRQSDIAVEGDRIAEIKDGISDFSPEIIIDGTNKKLLVLPGLMNSHIHTDETLNMSYIPDNVSHVPWFRDWTMPYYESVEKEDLYWSAMLSFVHMLKCGTTCFADSANLYPYETARAAEQSGIRGFVARWTSDMNDEFSTPVEKCVELNEELIKKLNKPGRIVRAIASVIGVNKASNSLYKEIFNLAKRNDTLVTSHEASGHEDVELCVKRTGKRPVENLFDIGFLSERTLLSHLTDITQKEAELILKTNTAIVTCPTAELKKGKGFTKTGKIPVLIRKGARICVGTDTANSSNHLNVARASQIALLIAKDVARDAAIADVWDCLSWITEKPYAIFGVKDAGLIQKGNLADLAVFELDYSPSFSDMLQEFFFGDSLRCLATIVNGELLYHEGKFSKVNPELVLAECNKRAQRIHERIGN